MGVLQTLEGLLYVLWTILNKIAIAQFQLYTFGENKSSWIGGGGFT